MIETVRGIDLLIPLVSGYISYLIRFENWYIAQKYIYVMIIASLLTALVFPSFSLYQSKRGAYLWKELRLVSLAWTSIFASLTALAFITQKGDYYSRQWFILWFLFGEGMLLFYRTALRQFQQWLRKKGYNFRTVIIVGAGDLGKKVVQQLQEMPWTGLRVIAFFDDNPLLQRKRIHGVRVRGTLNDIDHFLKHCKANQLWLTLPLRSEKRIKALMQELRHYSLEIRLVPDIFTFQLLNHSITEVAEMPVINLSASPISGWNIILKAVEDRILAGLFLLLTSPLMLLIALGIKITSPGPVFFRQLRHGWNGATIEVFKFRTMEVQEHNEFKQATVNDPRVTPFGRFLRGTSLDELPQFINVFQGKMSIVGPRPHPLPLNEQFKELINQYMLRHKVKPGITGWAQVNGWRGETDTLEKMKKRIEHDLYYIRNWSLWLDFKIIVMTLYKGFINPELQALIHPQKTLSSSESSVTVKSSTQTELEPLFLLNNEESSLDIAAIKQQKERLMLLIEIDEIHESRELLQELSSQLSKPLYLCFEGLIFTKSGAILEANKYFTEALSMLTRAGDATEREYIYIKSTENFAINQCKLGEDYHECVSMLENLLSHPAIAHDKETESSIRVSICAIHYFNQQYSKAVETINDTIPDIDYNQHTFKSQLYLLLALSHAQLRQMTRAKECYQQALKLLLHIPPSTFNAPSFCSGWLGWIPLSLIFQKTCPTLDQCLPDLIHPLQNIFELYQHFIVLKKIPLPESEQALEELTAFLLNLQNKSQPYPNEFKEYPSARLS
ncbi:undecaprenyl-phosphate glucose phosphotransferase [Deltaproteobacteria bacterium TL4]